MGKRNEPSKLEVAVEDLKSYFGVLTQADVFNTMISSKEDISESVKNFKKTQFSNLTNSKKREENRGIAKIMSMLQSQQSGFFAHEIMSEMENYITGDHKEAKAKELDGIFTVVYEDSFKDFKKYSEKENPGTTTTLKRLTTPVYAEDGEIIAWNDAEVAASHREKRINQAPKSPSKDKPALSAFVVQKNTLNPSKRNSAAPELFFSAIPNIEMSRCVPFLDITVIPSAPALSDIGEKQTISFLQFLNGTSETSKKSDKEIAKSYDLNVRKNILNQSKKDSRTSASAGMEIFTAPQTMVNSDETYEEMAKNRNSPIIDKFRPFMSIKSFKVNLAPSSGLITFKTADINLILHDRSRLGEISELIKPDLFGRTELLITYGWSHPDGNSTNNVFGRFLDNLKCTEKYGIVNTQYTFDAVGQVNITLKLSLKGTTTLDLTDITSDGPADQALKSIETLTAAISAARKKLGSNKKKGSKSVSSSSILGKLSDTNSAMRFNSETIKKINKYIRSAKKSKSPDVKEIVDALKKLKKELPKARDKIGFIAARKIGNIYYNRYYQSDTFEPISKKATPEDRGDGLADPFMMSFQGKNKENSYVSIDERDAGWASFGHILLMMVGYPLARSGQFDEVQFIFYSFNEFASYMRGAPISSFPINIDDLHHAFVDACKTSTKMSLMQFIKFIDRKFISTQTSRAYGLRDQIYEKDKKTGKRKLKELYKDTTLLRSEKDMRLEDAYGEGTSPLRFKVPRIQMHAECLDGPSSDQTIYRVHIYDANATSHSTFAQILKASEDEHLEALTSNLGKLAMESKKNKNKAESNSGFRKDFVKQINLAITNQVLETIPKNMGAIKEADLEKGAMGVHFRVKSNFAKVKQMLHQNMPSITYGTSNSNITQANVGSLNSPALTNIHMRKSGLGAGNTPLGVRDSGLPLQVAPMKLQVQSLGMPMMTVGQQYFIDFGTGTSVDTIYVVAKVRHEISAGKFTTSIDFTPLNSYGQYTNVGNVVDQAIAELTDSKSK